MSINKFSTHFMPILLLTSCTTKEVQLRVRNSSSYTYDSVVVNTTGGESTYGTIPAGAVSDYKTFDFAYSYAYISLKIDTTSYILQPIDYVGEQKLQSGNYTYVVSVYDTATHQLGLTLLED
jgi:hypothetical protein